MVENSGKSLISAPQVQLSAIQVEQAAQQEVHSSVVLGKPKVQSVHRMYWIKKKLASLLATSSQLSYLACLLTKSFQRQFEKRLSVTNKTYEVSYVSTAWCTQDASS